MIVGCLLAGLLQPPALAQTAPPLPALIGQVTYPSTGPLAPKIAALLADPAVSRAHWGVAVTTLDGQPLYGLDEGKLFRPASNNKVFTTAAAMALLGPAKRFETRIIGALDAATGVVEGDLVLVGGGDANFGGDDLPYVPHAQRAKDATGLPGRPTALGDLAAMADQLAAEGVKRVKGDIVGDDTLFPWEPYADSWAADDLVWGYGAPVSALSIADNQMKLTVTPGIAAGPAGHRTFAPATVALEQSGVDFYAVVAQVETVAGPHSSEVQVERLPGSRTVRVYGNIAAEAKPDVEYLAISDPAEYVAVALRAMLEARGIAVEGEAHARHAPAVDGNSFLAELRAPGGCEALMVSGGVCDRSCAGAVTAGAAPPNTAVAGTVLATHLSAPLGEDVVLTNKVSQNLHAELLLHHLGELVPCGRGSIVEGARMVRAFLLHAGLDGDDFTFFDGSGLSAHDLVAPRAMAQFLAFSAKQPWFAQWKASLPEGGVDGSLDARFPGPPLKGHLFAKTGTLGETRALSGYLDGASGRTVIFSIFVDEHSPGSSADRVAMDKIVAAIAAAE